MMKNPESYLERIGAGRRRSRRNGTRFVLSSMAERICKAKGYSLRREPFWRIICTLPWDAPWRQLRLAFLNNLAFVHEMKPVFQYGAFLATFGEYHDGAVKSEKEE